MRKGPIIGVRKGPQPHKPGSLWVRKVLLLYGEEGGLCVGRGRVLHMWGEEGSYTCGVRKGPMCGEEGSYICEVRKGPM